jgi:hypothetical protein
LGGRRAFTHLLEVGRYRHKGMSAMPGWGCADRHRAEDRGPALPAETGGSDPGDARSRSKVGGDPEEEALGRAWAPHLPPGDARSGEEKR